MVDTLDARIGRNLREIRLKAGFAIDALAHRTGQAPAVLTRYEAGRLRIPVEVLTRLAEALGCPLCAFFA